MTMKRTLPILAIIAVLCGLAYGQTITGGNPEINALRAEVSRLKIELAALKKEVAEIKAAATRPATQAAMADKTEGDKAKPFEPRIGMTEEEVREAGFQGIVTESRDRKIILVGRGRKAPGRTWQVDIVNGVVEKITPMSDGYGGKAVDFDPSRMQR
jgi:hypothetical protein